MVRAVRRKVAGSNLGRGRVFFRWRCFAVELMETLYKEDKPLMSIVAGAQSTVADYHCYCKSQLCFTRSKNKLC